MKLAICGLLLILCLSAVQAASFEVREIEVDVTYPPPYDRFSSTRDKEDSNIQDNATIQADIYPGSEVEFAFLVENILPSDGEDVKQLFGLITVEDLDDGDDVEVETDDVDLDPGQEERLRAIIHIPTKVEDKDYDLTLEVEGDVNGTDEKIKFEFIMKVKKDASDLKVTLHKVAPATVACERSIMLSSVMTNAGKNEETDAGFEILSVPLGIKIKRENIVLDEDPFDEDNDFVLNVPFTISQDVVPGEYAIDFRALYKNQLVMDSRTATIVVQPCGTIAQEPEPIQAEEPVEASIPGKGEEQQESGSEALPSEQPGGASIEKPFTSSPVFIVLLALGNIAVVALLVYVGAKLIAGKGSKGAKGAEQEQENEQ
jgi:hypothetical protein